MEGDYDEFGNYIGPDLGDEEDDERGRGGDDEEEDDRWADEAEARAKVGHEPVAAGEDAEMSTAVVLHEDKKYYPTADEVYGPGTETLIMEEDAQPLEQPIVAAVKEKRHEVIEREALPSLYPPEFLVGLMDNPHLIRNVALVGHLHHGKTSLMDMLVEQTHVVRHQARSNERTMRYTDTRVDEQEREISVKAVPMSLVHQGASGKSYLLNLMDAPGHVGFSDEMTAALRLADAALLVVDAVEGVMMNTERAVRAAAAEGLPVLLFISKVDRLIVELKLPPADAYVKLRHILEEVNALVAAAAPDAPPLDPVAGNVCFGSAAYGWCFTLESFAKLYVDIQGASNLDHKAFARRLWGDSYFHPDTRAFKRKPPAAGGERSFVSFVLEPLWKVYATCVGEHPSEVERVLGEMGVFLKGGAYKQDVKPLLKTACSKIFGTAAGLVDMLVAHAPSSHAGCARKVAAAYTGPQDGAVARACARCDGAAPLVAQVVKMYPKPDCSAFDCLARVFAGTLSVGDRVRVLGEGYTPEDEEDAAVKRVTALWVLQARYRVPLASAGPGNWVLVEGVDGSIAKTATLVAESLGDEDVHIFAPLRFGTASVVKIATEPLNPSDLPKMVEGLRKINKSYPLAVTKVEESGEHTVMGTGEIFLDSVMRDLREMYADVEVKVADPTVRFCETAVETSSLKCFAETPNKRNKLTFIAEPLDKGLAEDIEGGRVAIDWPRKRLGEFFQARYDWDLLAARSVWAFGPDRAGPNVLLDDTLPSEVDKGLLGAVRESIVQGFQWGAREGPLCDEPMRNVKFKLLDATVAAEPLHRGGGQIIPTARRVAYSSFLLATPRLMEPMLAVEIQTPADCMSAIYTVLSKRRGHVVSDKPVAGTPVYVARALLPAIESFGFETDLRYHTQGQAFGLSVFDSWQVVPGDPLDRSVVLRPLEPSAPQQLAREFMVKTRRRKGMSEDVSVSKFFDDAMVLRLAEEEGGGVAL